ncbi:hypothetical protein Tco_1358214 [Tanacetum coccineum]
MDSDKYLEGQSMQRPPLFESDHFTYWKKRYETYVKAKDLDLWHIILNDDIPPVAKNEVTQILEVVPFEEQSDNLKKKLAKNNEAKMVLYNALPKKEYERIFMCKTAKDIWQSLLITHQAENNVKKFLRTLTSKMEEQSLNRSMDSDKYLEGQSMQRPPLFESDHFIYWKNRFETYVKAKDLDLWHIILNGDFPPVARNKETQILEIVPFEQQDDDLKKKLAKNNKAKMVLYNALPKKEYERIFMCKTAKDIWQSLLITHQGNSQVKDNKIDLLVQQYEQFTILEEESIDSGFARFNTIITSLKALDEDLSSLALEELIGNLKVHEVVMETDSEIYRGKKKRVKSIALKAKKESSDDETSTSESDDEEYAMAVRNFKKFFRRKGNFVRQPREKKKSFRQRDEKKGKSDQKCFRCGDPNDLIGDCLKPSRNKDQKAFIRGSRSDSENDAHDETCLMAQSSNEVCLRTCLEPDEWIKDSGCSKHMTGNKNLFSTYKAYDGGNIVFESNLKGKNIGKGTISNDSLTISNVEHVDNLDFTLLSVGQICDNKCQVLFTKEGSEIIKDGKTKGNVIRKNDLYVIKLGNNLKTNYVSPR